MASKTKTKKPMATFGKGLPPLVIAKRIIKQLDSAAMSSSTHVRDAAVRARVARDVCLL
jgi:hypothetical protein